MLKLRTLIAGFGLCVAMGSLASADPMPYDSIRNPLRDTLDQLIRDSANLKISRLRVNQAGYRTIDVREGMASFYGIGSSPIFQVIDAKTGAVRGAGAMTAKGATTSGQIRTRASNWAGVIAGGDTRYIVTSPVVAGAVLEGRLPLDLPAGGPYRIAAGPDTSAPFIVSDNVYGMVRDGVLKFFGIQRSGTNFGSWFHGASHMKDGAIDGAGAATGIAGSATGGWYDCGDHLKEGITMGYAMATLSTLSAALPERDQDHYGRNHNITVRKDGIPDILAELKWGSDFALKNFENAGKNVTRMVTSVGDFGKDHQWWGRPEYHDGVPLDRGGWQSRISRIELGANILGNYAAGLAAVSRLYQGRDPAYAARALEAAKALYAYAKANPKETNTPAYNGAGDVSDDLAHAAVMLLWATKDPIYLNDIAYDKVLGNKGSTAFWSSFEGGWFVRNNPTHSKGMANHDWGSIHSMALYAFYKLILSDPAAALAYGVKSEAERQLLVERTVAALALNLGGVSAGSVTIDLPQADMGWYQYKVSYEPVWNGMFTQQEWVWNRYQAGNTTELFFWYDVTAGLEGKPLPHFPATTNWKRKEIRQLMVRQMDYLLGVNNWDWSMILGLGSKNPNHPHHRAANPEGRNMPGALYKYVPPVGALYGGYKAGTEIFAEHFDDYRHTEVCLDGAASLIVPAVGLSLDIPDKAPPQPKVKVEYVGDTLAIVSVELDEWGDVVLHLGTDSLGFPRTVASDSAGVIHRIRLPGLKPSTQYWFTVDTRDLGNNAGTFTHFPPPSGRRFGFLTRDALPSRAEIVNVKVCNVTHDSAEIMWYTPNGEFESEIRYGTATPPTQYQAGDIAGVPVKFHRMKIGNLKENTTYWFEVGSDGTWDNNGGKYYQFKTAIKSVDFDIYTHEYTWGGMQTMSMAVVSNHPEPFDSLEFRFYLKGTRKDVEDFGMRTDLAFKFRPDGFIDSGFQGKIAPLVTKQKPHLMPETCDAAGVCYWYMAIPTAGTVMETGARFRIDVVFDRHILERDTTELLNMAPTHKLGPADWSWGPHKVSEGAPFEYPGMPVHPKNTVDDNIQILPENYYVTVYRKNQFVYGWSPSSVENSTKKTDWEMGVQLDPPWNVPDGSVVDLAGGTQVRVKGIADVYDRLLPAVKGAVSDIWVNGRKLTPAEVVAAAKWDDAARNWKLDIPVRLQDGGNTVDITIFGGAPFCGDTCQNQGCAFANRNFFVNFTSTFTPSRLSVVDPAGVAVGAVVPDSSKLLVRLSDGNANKDKVAKDQVEVTARNVRTGAIVRLVLTETGPATGVFETTVLSVVPGAAAAGQISVPRGDSVVLGYVDAQDAEDSSSAKVWAEAAWPEPVRGGLFRDCDGAWTFRALFNKPFAGGQPQSVTATLPNSAGVPQSIPATSISLDAAGSTLTGSLGSTSSGSAWQGTLHVEVPDGRGGFVPTSVALADSVGPWIDSIKVVENLDGRLVDTVAFWASEPVVIPSGWPFAIVRGGVPVAAGAIDSVWLADATANKWMAAVRGGIRAGDQARFAPAVADGRGNAALECATQLRVVGTIIRPVPVSRAWIRDADGDGRADEVVVVFRRALRANEAPESIRAVFGAGDSVRVAMAAVVAGDSVLRVALPVPFRLADTRGSAPEGAGVLVLVKSGESSLPVALADSVPPALLRARLAYGSMATDTLELSFSEPVRRRAGIAWLAIHPGRQIAFAGEADSLSATRWRLPVDTGAVVPGDSVRPLATGRWAEEATGRNPASLHPWVPVEGGERAPAAAWYEDADADGAVERVTLVFSRTPKTRPAMALTWPDGRGGLETVVLDSGAWDFGSDGRSVLLPKPFARGVTASASVDHGRWISGGTTTAFAIADSVDPFIVSATVRYAAEGILHDTLRLTFTEKLQVWNVSSFAVVQRKGEDGLVETVRQVAWALSPDGMSAEILLDSNCTVLRRGDSVRIAPRSTGALADAWGNAAEDPSVWTRVVFGLRPPIFDIRMVPPARFHNGSKTVARGGSTAILARRRGDVVWMELDGTPTLRDTARLIGPLIRANAPMGGVMKIYDHLGTFAASISLDAIETGYERIPKDASGQYEVWIVWDGHSEAGRLAASGVYTARLITTRKLFEEGEQEKETIWNQLLEFGWIRR